MPWLATNGIETYVERRGEGPAIVFVHGPVVPHTVWTAQLAALSDAFTTIAYDLRGHGRTGPSPADPYSIQLWADDLAALVDALDEEPVTVVGLSMGGFIAQAYAARQPDALAGVVLLDPFTPTILDAQERLLRRAGLPALAGLARLVGFPRMQALATRLAGRIPHAKVQRPDLDWPAMSTEEFAKTAHALAHADREPIALEEITVPTLVLVGEDDLRTVHRQARHLHDEIEDARLQTIADAGHGAHIVHPEDVNPRIRAFVEEVHPRGVSPSRR